MHFARSKRFDKHFRKLSAQLRMQAQERMRLFAADPFHPLLNDHSLRGEHQNQRSINITGDLRIIYEMVSQDVAKLIDIGTHGELYG